MNDVYHLGLLRGTVQLVPYHDEWKRAGEECVSLRWDILGEAAHDIQHVGSTAVPGLHAKPIIDIAVGVDSFGRIMLLRPVLEEHGLIFRGEDVPGQLLFVIGSDDIRTHHIHVVRWKDKAWNDYITFRDKLRGNPILAKKYDDLKLILAERYHDNRKGYTQAKGQFVTKALYKIS